MKKVIHYSYIRENRLGGTITASVCGINALTDDGMNLGLSADVTCKRCEAYLKTTIGKLVKERSEKLRNKQKVED